MSGEQAAKFVQAPKPGEGALYTHTEQPKSQSADLNNDGLRDQIHAQGQKHVGDSMNTPTDGNLADPKNPNTFINNDPDKSQAQLQKENHDKWDHPSEEWAKKTSGDVSLHTDGAGPVRDNSVAAQKELPQVKRPDGPATSVTRVDHNANTAIPEWQRPGSSPPSSGPAPPAANPKPRDSKLKRRGLMRARPRGPALRSALRKRLYRRAVAVRQTRDRRV